VTHQYGIERGRPANPHGARMRMRVTNRRHIVTFDTSGDDGRTWRRFDRGMEVSGYHHNVRGGFLMLRPGPLCRRARRSDVPRFPLQRAVRRRRSGCSALATVVAIGEPVPI
jgi:beta-xylosidase